MGQYTSNLTGLTEINKLWRPIFLYKILKREWEIAFKGVINPIIVFLPYNLAPINVFMVDLLHYVYASISLVVHKFIENTCIFFSTKYP